MTKPEPSEAAKKLLLDIEAAPRAPILWSVRDGDWGTRDDVVELIDTALREAAGPAKSLVYEVCVQAKRAEKAEAEVEGLREDLLEVTMDSDAANTSLGLAYERCNRAEAEVRRLREYVQHAAECVLSGEHLPDEVCDCGLDDG